MADEPDLRFRGEQLRRVRAELRTLKGDVLRLWEGQHGLDGDVASLRGDIARRKAQIDGLGAEIDRRFATVDRRLETVDGRVDRLSAEMDGGFADVRAEMARNLEIMLAALDRLRPGA